MSVKRFILAAVFQLDGDSIGAITSSHFDDADTGRPDRGAIGYAEIHAGMHFGVAEERVNTHAETRGDLGAGNRGLEQRTRGTPAVFVIVVGLAVGRGVAEISLRLSVEGELCVVEHLALG